VVPLRDFIADAEATSGKYWIASIFVGAVVMALEAYQKRWSIILALTVALLIFHPHLTIRAFPKPSCEVTSVQGSQLVLAALVLMLVYQVVKIFAFRRTAEGVARDDGQGKGV
jgi:predicted cobalt transporter CbtA